MRTDLDPAAFAALLAAPGLQAVSFDVFDTALVRTFARATDLFAELGRRLADRQLTTMTPEHFSHLRVQAEVQARRNRADTEPGLTEIHQVLALRLGWTNDQRAAAEQLEITLELASIRAVPRVRGWIEAARASGRRIAFVSDMYLPLSVIRTMLTDAKLARPGDPILVSCTYRVTKADGGLFDQLIETLSLPPDAILHVGDNVLSDGVVPRRKGLRTLRVEETGLGFFEERLLAYQHDTGGLSGRLAATARLARLACSPDGTAPALSEIGTGLLGPWLACFALWIFERARRGGIRRLYFVSRDGQVMREIALAVQAHWAPAAGIECRYLHGSRLAWHQGVMTDFSDHQLAWLLNPQPRINADILAGRLGLAPERLGRLFAATPAAGLISSPAWDAAAIDQVAAVLRRLAAEIMTLPEIAARRDLTRRYLEQEGLLRDSAWAVVELGWSGSMMVSLHEALGRPPGLTAYYLNLSSRCPALPAEVRLESFAINPNDVSGHMGQGLRFAEMIEVLTAADHGTVLGYAEQAGRVGPRLNTGSPALWPPAALAALREGAKQFVEQMPAEVMTRLAAQLAADAPARIVAHQLMLVLADFMRTPPAELAQVFTACRFTEDPTDQDQRGFVQPLAFWPVLRSGWQSERELWAQGTLACTPPVVAALARGGATAAAAQLWRGLLRRLSPVA
jgi:FMN phosphatase YigB (HAD superfamily)